MCCRHHARTIERLLHELEEAQRSKDEFLATVSHELRTPLTAILGWSSFLVAEGAGDDRLRERALSTIERNAKEEARIIDALLDVSRVVGGAFRLEVQRADVAAFVSAAVDVVRPAASAKSIALDLRIDASAGSIDGDAGRLQQVVWNLLTNAVRFTSSSGTIRVEVTRSEEGVTIAVRDDGIGIAREELPRLFGRFHQVDGSSTRAHGGLGLGLALVRHLVELHGGTVTAASEGRGKGATFTVTLPVGSRGRRRERAIDPDADREEEAVDVDVRQRNDERRVRR